MRKFLGQAPGPLPSVGNSPYDNAAGAAYFQTMVLTGGNTAQATVAARAAVGLPPEETSAEALDRLVQLYDDAGDTSNFRAQCAAAHVDPDTVIAEHARRAAEYHAGGGADAWKMFLQDAAGLAVISMGAIFLGPMIAGKLGAVAGASGGEVAGGAAAGSAEAAAAGTEAASAASAVAAGGVSATTASTAAGVVAATQKAIGVVNLARTGDAVLSGKAPPPPINLTGDSFIDWSKSLGMSLLNGKMAQNQQELNALQQQQASAQMGAYIRALVSQAVANGSPIVGTASGITDPTMLAAIAQQQQQQAQRDSLIKYGAIAAAIIVGVGLISSR